MKALCNIFILFFIGINIVYSQTLPENFKAKISSQTNFVDGEYDINYEGNDFIININGQKLTSLRASLFQDSIYESMNRKILNYIEEAYAAYLLKTNAPEFNDFHFKKGSWENLNTFNQGASFTLSNNNNQSYTAIWNNKKDSVVILTFPISYDRTNKGTRSEIENRYIEGLKHFTVKGQRPVPHVAIDELEQIADSIYILPGNSYIISNVSSNSYFTVNRNDGKCELIMDANNPQPTVANMIVRGDGFDVTLELRIAKHEYGESETISIPLEAFIQYNIANGCDIFWGFDSLDSNILKGTIFCYNSNEGYDHTIRVELDTTRLGSDKQVMKGHASLFVPTNNVQNLFQEKNKK